MRQQALLLKMNLKVGLYWKIFLFLSINELLQHSLTKNEEIQNTVKTRAEF